MARVEIIVSAEHVLESKLGFCALTGRPSMDCPEARILEVARERRHERIGGSRLDEQTRDLVMDELGVAAHASRDDGQPGAAREAAPWL